MALVVRFAVLVLVVVAGCGRLGFDPRTDSTDDASTRDSSVVDGPDLTIPPGAKVWLRMDGEPTAGIIDSAGGHNVHCNGTCPTLVAGKHGNGFVFNGEEVILDNRSDLDSSAGFTAAIWINLKMLPSGVETALTKTFDSGNGYDTFTLSLDANGEIRFDGETPGGVAVTESGGNVAVGEWHHMAIAWDGTKRRDYLDGMQVMSNVVQIGSGTEAMEVGFARGAYYIDAVLDDAVYYTRALTPAEIMQLAAP